MSKFDIQIRFLIIHSIIYSVVVIIKILSN